MDIIIYGHNFQLLFFVDFTHITTENEALEKKEEEGPERSHKNKI